METYFFHAWSLFLTCKYTISASLDIYANISVRANQRTYYKKKTLDAGTWLGSSYYKNHHVHKITLLFVATKQAHPPSRAPSSFIPKKRKTWCNSPETTRVL